MNRSFAGLAGTYFENMTDTTGPTPERAAAMRTSPRFFSVLGTPAALGRTPTPEEEIATGPAVVVLSDGFWRRRFGADPSVIGRSLTLGGAPQTIVGVMPPSFRFPSATTEVWVPARLPFESFPRTARFYATIGRLKPDVTHEQAQQDLTAIQRRLGEQYPRTDKGWRANVVPLKEEQVGGVRRSLWLLFGAVLLVLLTACGNVACLLLASSARREPEMAVRFALGADRRRIVRQLLLEGLLLSLIGSAVGLLLARWGIGALRSAALELPRAAELHVDLRLAAFTLALGVATTLVFALAPALQATRREVSGRLAHGGRGLTVGGQALQSAVVVAQITLALVLLVGAGLLIRSFWRLQQVQAGFDPDHVLTFRMSAAWGEEAAAVADRQSRTLARLRSIPGVTSVALASVLPSAKDADYPLNEFTIAGRDSAERLYAMSRNVSADYFRTPHIPVLQGDTCRDEAPVETRPIIWRVLVNQALASRSFPGENPIGQRVVQQFTGEIVGVVADAREQSLMKAPQPIIYICGLMPYWPDPHHLVRTDPARPVSMTAIRAALREIEPQRAVYDAATLDARMAEALFQPRLNTLLLALFAGTALALAAIGLHGVLAHFVTQKRREIGVRMALGARPAQVLAHVIRHGAWITGAGVALGLTGAFGLARLMAALLFEIPPRDPLTFTVVPFILAVVAAAAILVPARRAARVDPMRTLRED